jgi:hypothetical protein
MAEKMLYLPELRNELLEAGIDLYIADEEYLKKDWLKSTGLMEEIEQ